MADSSEWQDWVVYAENDWAGTRLLLPDLPTQATYLMVQSVEKYLKAVLLFTGQEPSRTHNLKDLLLSIDPNTLRSSREWIAADLLTRVTPISRYPADIAEPTRDEAQQLFDAAGFLRKLARAKLGLETQTEE
jgi:HEPN domain-containing protein